MQLINAVKARNNLKLFIFIFLCVLKQRKNKVDTTKSICKGQICLV